MAEIKAVEAQNPVYADAKRQMEKTNQLRIDTTKVEKEVKREEKPKRPKMTQGAKKMHLDESLFEMNDNNIEFVKSFLNKLVSDNRVRALKDGERLPKGFTFKSSSGTNGEVTYNGTDYAYALVNGELKVMPSRDAGYNWSETIYKESLNDEALFGTALNVMTREEILQNIKDIYNKLQDVSNILMSWEYEPSNSLESFEFAHTVRLEPGKKFFRWQNYGSSTAKNTLEEFEWLVNKIFDADKYFSIVSLDEYYKNKEEYYEQERQKRQSSLNNVLKDDSTIEEAWATFEYKSGGNPYIAKTEKEKQRILNKYKGKVKETKKGFYEIDDRKSDNFLPEAVTNLNAKKYTAQEFVDIATSNGVEGADIILDWDDTANKREPFNVWKSYLLDTYLDLEDDLYNMNEKDTIERNRKTVIYPLMDLREPEVINESLNEELDDRTKLEVKTELINMTRAYPNEHGFNVKTAEIKDFVKKELKSMGYKVEISGEDRVSPMQYHIEYYKKLNESKLTEGAKGFLRTLGRDTVQYFTHKNRFNYTIKQIRIDNKNKTYEFGNFKIPYRLESTQNGKEFERLVDKLKEMGYTEIKKSLKERLAKRK